MLYRVPISRTVSSHSLTGRVLASNCFSAERLRQSIQVWCCSWWLLTPTTQTKHWTCITGQLQRYVLNLVDDNIIIVHCWKNTVSFTNIWVLASEERKQSLHGVEVVSIHFHQNNKHDKHQSCFYVDTIKQKMINNVQVPVQQSQLNMLILLVREEKTLPIF